MPGFLKILFYALLNGPRTHGLFELAQKECSVAYINPHSKIRCQGFTRFVVEGNGFYFAAFASDAG